MKISMFYVTQKQRVIEEKDVKKAIEGLVKMGVSALVITQVTPLLMDMIGEPIVAQASSFAYNGSNSGDGAIGESVDKIISKADEIVNALQRIAQPTAYGFAVKGILEKMSGQDVVGTKHIKEALKGYVMIQILPLMFDVIDIFR